MHNSRIASSALSYNLFKIHVLLAALAVAVATAAAVAVTVAAAAINDLKIQLSHKVNR